MTFKNQKIRRNIFVIRLGLFCFCFVLQENQRDWLNDPLGREQFIYRCRAQTYIMAHDAIERTPEEVIPSDARLGRSIFWSPRGSYLVAFHKQGIWLRANFDFVKTVRKNKDIVKGLGSLGFRVFRV